MPNPTGNFRIIGSQSVTEDLSFFKGAIVGCGEAAALVIAHILKGQPINPDEVTSLIKSAAAAGKLNGAGNGQTVSDVQWDLNKFGISSTVRGFNNNFGSSPDIFGLIDKALQSGTPVEIGINNGSALTGESSSLRGHYITLVGEQNGNFLAADANTQASKGGGFVQESWQQLVDANPFAVFFPSDSAGSTTSNADANNKPLLNNPIDIAGAINNLGSNIGSQIASGIGSAISDSLLKPFHNIGITSFADFGWRALFIIVAVIILLIGFAGILQDFSNKNGPIAVPIPV